MCAEKPVVDGIYEMKKFAGKGGWTYVEIPQIKQNKNNPFGWVIVKGSIDNYELKHNKLMPMGNGKLFLPVKAKIRRIIGKQAGDNVRVVLTPDASPLEIPDDLLACFAEEPKNIFETFTRLNDNEKKAYMDWIDSARTDLTKVKRIAVMMSRLQLNLKFGEVRDS